MLRQGSRDPLACLRMVPGTNARTKGLTGHFLWPIGRSGGWGVAPVARILGRMRLRLQAASRERCLLQQRLTSQVVRACCTLRFSWRLNERNNYELAGSHCGIQLRPRQVSVRRGSLCRLPLLATDARFVGGLRCKVGWRHSEGSLIQRLGGWPRTTPSFVRSAWRRCREKRFDQEVARKLEAT